MGAGHCPWGGYTDRIVCNIDGQVHLASRYILVKKNFLLFFSLLSYPSKKISFERGNMVYILFGLTRRCDKSFYSFAREVMLHQF